MTDQFPAGLRRLFPVIALVFAFTNIPIHGQDKPTPASPSPQGQPATAPGDSANSAPPASTVPAQIPAQSSVGPEASSPPSIESTPPAESQPSPSIETQQAPAVPAENQNSGTGMPAPPIPNAEPGYDGKPEGSSKPVIVSITNPHPDEILNENKADIFFSVDNYKLAEGGNRLEVIFDNNSPVQHADIKRPFSVKELSEGGHFVRVYAVAPDGRAFTNPEATATVHFFVRKKDFQNFINPKDPYLTVNLPTDGFLDIEEGDRIWLDFRSPNAKLTKGGDYFIHYKINNVEDYIQDDEPLFWQGLKPGRYELMIELVDKDKKLIPGPFNQVKRTFDLRITQKALPTEMAAPKKLGNTPPEP